eukprot:1150099-Pelagomonas_calceolata.AAC.15
MTPKSERTDLFLCALFSFVLRFLMVAPTTHTFFLERFSLSRSACSLRLMSSNCCSASSSAMSWSCRFRASASR